MGEGGGGAPLNRGCRRGLKSAAPPELNSSTKRRLGALEQIYRGDVFRKTFPGLMGSAFFNRPKSASCRISAV